MLRNARRSDIGLLCAVYSRAIGEWGLGPIADLDAVITASITGKPLILPYDSLFDVDGGEFNIDVTLAETSNREFAGFSVARTIVKNGKSIESRTPFGVSTELWYLAIAPEMRGLGIGGRLVRHAVALVQSRTRGRGGLLARVLEPDYITGRALQAHGFVEIGHQSGITRILLHPKSNTEDLFADIGDLG